MSSNIVIEPIDPDASVPEVDETPELLSPEPLAAPGSVGDYTVNPGEDLQEIFDANFRTVSGDGWASRDVYALAYKNGYRVRTKRGVPGWVATLK